LSCLDHTSFFLSLCHVLTRMYLLFHIFHSLHFCLAKILLLGAAAENAITYLSPAELVFTLLFSSFQPPQQGTIQATITLCLLGQLSSLLLHFPPPSLLSSFTSLLLHFPPPQALKSAALCVPTRSPIAVLPKLSRA
jgi:hypothetical protein